MASSLPARPVRGVDDSRPRFIACGVSIVLFVIACLLPAMVVRVPHSGYSMQTGFELLWFGPLGVFSLNFGWCANPLLVVALIMLALGKDPKALRFGVVACVLGASSVINLTHPPEVREPGIGFFVWLASLLVVPATAILLQERQAESQAQASSSVEPNA